MEQIHAEINFEALPYEARREKARQLIEAGVTYIEKRFGAEPDAGRYDVTCSAIDSYQDRDFIQVQPKMQRAMSESNAVQFTYLFGELDRSASLRAVWEAAQAVLARLEQIEAEC